MKQIEGQLSLFDILKPENVTNLTAFDPYDFLTWCDWCAYQDKMGCCTYDEPLGRFCCQGDGFKPKCKLPKAKKKTCAGCAHFHEVVSGLGEIYHSTACLKDRPWARFKDPEDPACEAYEERGTG